MRRVPLLLLAAVAVPLAAMAQLKPPGSPTETRPVSLPGSPPSGSPTATRPVSLPDSPPDRSREEGENARPRGQTRHPAQKKPATSVPAPPMRPVYNSKGQRLEGMRQAGANRVFDTRTGRYYTTTPSGTGQRIVPPPAGARPTK